MWQHIVWPRKRPPCWSFCPQRQDTNGVQLDHWPSSQLERPLNICGFVARHMSLDVVKDRCKPSLALQSAADLLQTLSSKLGPGHLGSIARACKQAACRSACPAMACDKMLSPCRLHAAFQTSMHQGTIRFGSTAKVLAKFKLNYYTISECRALATVEKRQATQSDTTYVHHCPEPSGIKHQLTEAFCSGSSGHPDVPLVARASPIFPLCCWHRLAPEWVAVQELWATGTLARFAQSAAALAC